MPFTDVADAVFGLERALLLETAANVLLFVPFGAALRLRGFAIRRTAFLGLCVSAFVEVAQLLFISGRTASLDDVLLNTFGAVVGNVLVSRWTLER